MKGKNNKIVMYTDGSCLKNPGGPGGWGVVVVCEASKSVLDEFYGRESTTTNNRMELVAVRNALLRADERSDGERLPITIYSDSQYVVRGMKEWIIKWRPKKFRGVKNSDLWIEIDTVARRHDVVWNWIKGHAGCRWNHRADQLAKLGAEEAKLAMTLRAQPDTID